MNTDTVNHRCPTGPFPTSVSKKNSFFTYILSSGSATQRLFMLTAFSLAAALSASSAYALPPIKQKTTGSNIVRSVEQGTGDEVQLEPVEVMIGAVLDSREAAREARDEPSTLPDLPMLGSDDFLDDVATAATRPQR